jgi:hypothetical protein
MELAGIGKTALCHGMAIRDDNIILGEIVLFDRKRHQREQVAMKMARKRKLLKEAGSYLAVLEVASELLRQEIQGAKDISPRKDLEHSFQYFLGASVGNKPFVNYSYARSA